jgi:hypothetical protein
MGIQRIPGQSESGGHNKAWQPDRRQDSKIRNQQIARCAQYHGRLINEKWQFEGVRHDPVQSLTHSVRAHEDPKHHRRGSTPENTHACEREERIHSM